MKPLPIGDLLREYERGAITSMELDCRLVQAAATATPEQVAPFLPTDRIGTLRTLAASPPRSLEDAPRIIAMEMTPSAQQEERQLWFEGIWRWHQFFAARNVSA